MRLLVLSDLHLEHGASLTVPPGVDYDVVILAGDIHSPGTRAVRWAARESTFGGRPVVYVPGNHEFYVTEVGAELEAMRQAAQGTPVHVLSRDSVVVQGVRFLGATLWTDFALPVGNESEPSDYHEETDVARALEAANLYVMDFRAVRLADQSIPRHRGEDIKHRLLRAEDTLAMHWVDRDWLRRELEVGHAGPTVVVTHHAPHRGSVAKRYRSDWVTPAFVSDLPGALFEGESMWVGGRKQYGGPVLWVHGHTHTGFDYQVAGCRVVSNPRGYRMRDSSWENSQFDPGLVVDVTGSTRHESVFDAEREQVVHALLEHWRREGSDAQVSGAALAGMAGTSPSTVSTTLEELERQAWVDVTGSAPTLACRIRRPELLLDAWAQAWKERLPKEKRTRWYAYASGPGGIVDHMLQRLSGHDGWAMTGAGAANALVPHLTSVDRVSIIVPPGVSEEWAADLQLEPVDKGANVTFIERAGASLMFGDTHPHRPSSRVASRWVMYLDLLDGVGRNKELAAEFRRRELGMGNQP
ncbi:type IV toxin-antitoxin system AbiEi family antitoxin [Roseateles sp. BYS78W]|uniref:Type IV toxin-antitoxin system AbiEi family antitoxin n=1 Tax=Pelomonas candidula TaxID=3299025 RepID=A0ABW7HE87_9BURK